MRIGSLNLSSNLFLSPLAGYTNLPFRLTLREIGGLDWPVGAVVGGLVLGVAESLAAGYLPAGWGDAVAYGLLVVVLLARPTGLIRAVAAVRV